MKRRFLLLMVLGIILSGCQSNKSEKIDLSFNDIKYVEYGDNFDSKTMIRKMNGVIEEYPLVDTKKIGKQILTFNVTLGDKIQSFEKEIEVKDGKKPIIELVKNKVTIDYRGKYKVSDYIKSVKDVVDGDIQYKDKNQVQKDDKNYYTYQDNVNVEKEGDYKIVITAVDINGNKTTTNIRVTVKSKESVENKPSTPQIPSTETPKPSELNQKDFSYVLPQTIEKTKISKKVKKIVTFTSTSYSSKSGTAQYFEKVNGKWIEKMKTSAIFGSQGMGKAYEGGKKSPVGTFYFTKAYGIKSNPGSRLTYTKINKDHYWCAEQYYNEFVDEKIKDHSGCSKKKDEHLIEYPRYYNYLAAFNYNATNIPGKGTAFFMHCKYSSSTGGCVAVDEKQMIYLLKNIDSSTALIIDQVISVSKH